MAKYKISSDGVLDTETNAFIPDDENNRHWQEYQLWVGGGNTADPEFTTQEIIDQGWTDLRQERDRLLMVTDFMMTVDFHGTMSTQEQTDVTMYRTTLRDLPGSTSDPIDPTWPTKPQIVIDNNI